MSQIKIVRNSDEYQVTPLEGSIQKTYHIPLGAFGITEEDPTTVTIAFIPVAVESYSWTGPVTDVLDIDGNPYATTVAGLSRLISAGIDVALQDQHTPMVMPQFNNVHGGSTIASDSTIDTRTVEVVSTTGAVIGNYVVIFEPAHEAFYFGKITNIVSTTLTLDTPLDHAFEIGSYIDYTTVNMNVNGSVTPVVFGLRGIGAPPGVDIKVDITRIIFGCTTTGSVDLAKFGDRVALTNGLVLRTRDKDGNYKNIFNVKANIGIAAVSGGDWTPYDANNLQQGQNGFTARMTFGGQEKIGVVVRLPIGTDLEFVIQDDFSSLLRFEVLAQGHIVEEI
jgi:hypothetical protein